MSDPIKPQDDSPASGPAQANPAWALGQLARAEAHLDQVGQGKQPNPSALARALDRIHAWRSAIAGMVSGAIEVGKRAPVRDLPAWCTLEVLHGGFASGKALAGGPAQAHERWWLQQLADGQPLGATAADCAQIARLGEQAEDAAPSPTPQPVSRTALNDWFLGEAGIAQLLRWLDDGCWRISVPEEGALLSVAWLLQNGHEAEATDILDAIRPHWDKLRFYPIPAATPMPALGGVSVLSAQALLEYLNGLQTPVQLQAQHEAIHVWRPLFDALVTLWLQAVPQALNTQEGEATAHTPRLRPGTREAEGGLPVSMPDAAWCERARAWLARCKEVCASHAHGGAHRKPGSPFMQMVRHLEAVLAGHALSEGDARQLRFLLACQVSAHGVPGRGRLYAQHYRIDTAALAHAVAAATRAWAVWADYVAAPEGAPGKRRLEQIAKKAVDAFYKKPDALTAHLYRRLGLTAYGDEPRSMRSIEINGAVIEQFQVVGTANFAPLALRFGWGEAGDDVRTWHSAAQAAFAALCAQLQAAHKPQLAPWWGEYDWERHFSAVVRRAAGAWRQVVLLSSLLAPAQQSAAFTAMHSHLGTQPELVARLLGPYLADLRACAAGLARDEDLAPFYGWASPAAQAMIERLQQARRAHSRQ